MRFSETREISDVLVTVSKTFNVGKHSEVYQSIPFKAGIMIDDIELCILILV